MNRLNRAARVLLTVSAVTYASPEPSIALPADLARVLQRL